MKYLQEILKIGDFERCFFESAIFIYLFFILFFCFFFYKNKLKLVKAKSKTFLTRPQA